MARETSARFHSILWLATLQAINKSNSQSLNVVNQQNKILEALGVAQHHDSITGTGLQKVVNDYMSRL